jgi:hypothetical protein
MKIFILAAFLMITAPFLSAQTIAHPLTNQTVQVGQSATFTMSVAGGPCRSLWTIAGAEKYGALASAFTYTTPPATAAMNGQKITIQLYSCTGGNTNLYSNAVLTVTTSTALNVTGSLKFDDATIAYVGALSVLQMSGTTWVSAGGINLDANGIFSGFLIVDHSLVDAKGNIELQFGIANPPVYVSQTFALAQFQQGSTGLTITWVLFKKAPTVTKAAGIAFTP